MINFNKNNQGFTLIELLVVVVIIGIIATLAITSLSSARVKSRDIKRISDIKELSTALFMYYNRQGFYPTIITAGQAIVSPDGKTTYMQVVPSNPTPRNDGLCTDTDYSYTVDDQSRATTYTISTCLGSNTGSAFAGIVGYSPDGFFNFALTYTLTYTAGSHGAITGTSPQTVNYGSNGTAVTAVAGTGYHFVSWSDDSTQNPRTDTNVTANKSVTATFAINIFVCGQKITDSDGNAYDTILIGAQCWMAQNMRTKKYPDGTCINPGCPDASSADNGLGRACYSNTESICTTDGALYTWAAAMNSSTTEGAQGICPNGFHIPTDNEYKTLEMSLGMSQVEADAEAWRGTHNEGTQLQTGGTSGFNGIIAGWRINDGITFGWRSTIAFIWSSSSYDGTYKWDRRLASGGTQVYRTYENREYSFSIRCLKD
jgi:uncharacterized protein (TIGR02145 family)/prepilin-type N-terminal cleavage/methylation domain-containing protein